MAPEQGNDRPKPKAILVAGPTASGKSALALRLAERLGGAVINADSMQVYRELRILTARPGPDEEMRAPHLLYGHVPLGAGYSVGQWLNEVSAALSEARRTGHLPIIVGGTGLYFRALTQGLTPIPAVPPAVRNKVRSRLDAEGPAALHAVLAGMDPETAARVPPTDPQRIARAVEVVEATGRTLTEWQRSEGESALIHPCEAVRAVLWPDRAALRERIAERLDEMVGQGAVEEVRRVAQLDLDPALPGARAHGLRPILAHLRGEITLAEAVRRTIAETRQYAKRQFTWFRHQMADWPRYEPAEAFAPLMREAANPHAGAGPVQRR